MPLIHLLPDHLVSQIAAGEVVERPASVVKELVENSLDAGASRIEVRLSGGGKRRIQVSDDGAGMDRDDALLAFDRHATSKISSFEELQRVATLGFRGEALATIAAVSRVELKSARKSGQGHRVRIEGGRILSVEPVAHPHGTSVDVASLFFNVPARRKFLKAGSTELRRAVEVVQGYVLGHPGVRFSLKHDDRELLDVLPANAGPDGARERICQLYGGHLAEQLTPLEHAGSVSGLRVSGFIGTPGTHRPRRIFVFVNRRLLRDRSVLATFYRSVREVWRSEEFPALFLFLELPPEDVDVNVHPQKAEVRFRDNRILSQVAAVLRDGLERGLGEGVAPGAVFGGGMHAPLAWEGLGGSLATADVARGDAGWELGEPLPVGDSSKLAEAVYAPLPERTVRLTGSGGEQRSFRLLGQYRGTLILLEGPDGLYLIDQHVAHERILYERLRREMENERPAIQALLEPILLELAADEALRLGELAGRLESCGFDIRALSGGTIALYGAPAALSAKNLEPMLLSLVRDWAGDELEIEDLRRRLLDSLAAGLACRAAVKMHEPLTGEEMRALVEELFKAEQPFACPHGRPIVLKMSDADLEHRFGRS